MPAICKHGVPMVDCEACDREFAEDDGQFGDQYDWDRNDPGQYCCHGTFIGSWWGPDILCGPCEMGVPCPPKGGEKMSSIDGYLEQTAALPDCPKCGDRGVFIHSIDEEALVMGDGNGWSGITYCDCPAGQHESARWDEVVAAHHRAEALDRGYDPWEAAAARNQRQHESWERDPAPTKTTPAPTDDDVPF